MKDEKWIDRVYAFDFEVFKFNWLVVFTHYTTGEKYYFWDSPEQLGEFLDDRDDIIIAGYNSKHYDNYILKGILGGLDNLEVKELSDFIVAEKQNGWEYPFPNPFIKIPANVDLMNDMGRLIGLKEVSCHLGMNILESEVPFDIKRPLREDEKQEVLRYCINDVDVVVKLIELRMQYLETKISLGKMAKLSLEKSLNLTNAKITAELLGAKMVKRDDEFDYVYPECLEKQYIPQVVLDCISDYQNGKNIMGDFSDEETKYKISLEFDILGVPHKLGIGGLHGAIPNYQFFKNTKRTLMNMDVGSYYPALLIEHNYLSRNIPEELRPLFKDIRDTRIKVKKTDPPLANTLKLPLNTTYGAQLNKYNPLYDPLMGRSACLSGQLFLIELIYKLAEVPSFQLVQSNTDGVMFSVENEYIEEAFKVRDDWCELHRFTMETDIIEAVFQKDVNNYIEVTLDSKGEPTLKVKGGVVSNHKGGSMLNANLPIVAKAIVEYLVNGIAIEDTINNCNDPKMFQMVAKVGSTYDRVVYE